MLLHILKKDLKRKRTMNVILLLFIIMATMFLASSVSNLLTISGAVDHFFEISKTPDYLVFSLGEDHKTIDKFFTENEYVTEYEEQELYTLIDEEIEIVKSAQNPEKQKFINSNTTAVEAVPDNFLVVFEGKEKLSLEKGEIALCKLQAEENDLLIGDVIRLSCGNKSMDFTLKAIVKDAVMGSQMMGFKRIFISAEDYEELTEGNASVYTYLHAAKTSDLNALLKDYNKGNFRQMESIERNTLDMIYVFDMLIAAILIVVSVCLILVSFLILRFTIVFTLQEDYKEIGIMKAIGIPDISMKGIYLLKYFAIATLGAGIGLASSFPFEKLLLSQVVNNFVIEDTESHFMCNIFCAVAIVALVLLFCYGSTGKIKQFTVMEAIRSGNNGERFKAAQKINLYKRKRMPAFFYLAFNDVLGSTRRYLILAFIFFLGMLEMLLPLTAMHTLSHESIIRTFSMQPCSVFIDNGKLEQYIVGAEDTREKVYRDLEKLEKELTENGLPGDAWIEFYHTISCYAEDKEESISPTVMQQTGKETDDYDMLQGQMPKLYNEIAITEVSAEKLGVGIGDTVHLQFPDKEKEFIVTGIYQSMMNMGEELRVSTNAGLPTECISGGMAIQVLIESDLKQEEIKQRIQDIYPNYEVDTVQEYLNSMIGNILDQLATLKFFIVAVVLVINILISVLTMKTLMARERGEIAMLKSIGFSNRTLREWQSARISIVLFAAMVLGTLTSKILSPIVIGPIFAMMGGTSIKLITDPLESYVIFPLILLLATGLASYVCAYEVSKVDLKEINTLE